MSWKVRAATPPLCPPVYIVQVIIKPNDRVFEHIAGWYNTSGYPRFKRIFPPFHNGSDFYFLMVEYSFLYRPTRLPALPSGSEFFVPLASFREKEEVMTVFAVSASGFVVSEVNPYFQAVFPPEPHSIHIRWFPFVFHPQSDIEVIIVPGKVNLCERFSASQMH